MTLGLTSADASASLLIVNPIHIPYPMKKFCQTFAAVLSVSLLLVGCGGKTTVTTDALEKEFSSAPPEIKQDADAAIAAINSDSYFAAVQSLNKLIAKSNDLNQAQITAARDTFVLASARAFEEGDAASKQEAKSNKDALEQQAQGSE